jgi:hypothetical protein
MPFRAIMEKMGARVGWDSTNNSVVAECKNIAEAGPEAGAG